MSIVHRRSGRFLTKTDVAVVATISLAGHGALAYQIARHQTTKTPVEVHPVAVELVPPPMTPPLIPPPPEKPKAEPPKPTVRRVARVQPTTPRPEPERPAPSPVAEAPHEEPGPVPEGDEPNAGPGGHGDGLPGPALPPAPPAPPAPAPIVAAHEGANYLKNPRPGYPEIALRRGWQGEVLLRVRVSPDGKPASISVQRSSGRDLLDQAAIEAVKSWSFVPARQGGLPIGGWVTVPIVFRLQGTE